MLRFVLLTLANLLLPFLVRAAYLYALRIWHKKNNKPQPAWQFPVVKLLLVGVALLFVSLFIYRVVIPTDTFSGNQVRAANL